jgi:hypothetical protein
MWLVDERRFFVKKLDLLAATPSMKYPDEERITETESR